MVFGKRNEKFISENNPLQVSLFADLQANEQPIETQTVEAHKRTLVKPKNNPNRQSLPAHLERQIITIVPENLPENAKEMEPEISETLEYIEPKMYVRQTIRRKYFLPSEEKIVIAKLPERIINKGILGSSLMAQIIVSKYVDHLPLHRQLQIFKRSDVELSYNTVIDGVNKHAKALAPLYDLIKNQINTCNYLQVDETSFEVMDESKKGNTHLGFMWVAHAPPNNLVLFQYHKNRNTIAAKALLQQFTGYLQTDAYSVYNEYNNIENITHLHCMAHVRRKFNDALKYNKEMAGYALELIQQLYAVERTIKDENYTSEQIVEIRKNESLPILNTFKNWLDIHLIKVTPKSPIGKAIQYASRCYHGLTHYIYNPILLIDNNIIENKIRPIALGRKNYLFAGSHDAAQNAAILYTLIACCKLNNVCPKKYFETVFEKLPSEKINNISYLLPNSDYWKTAE